MIKDEVDKNNLVSKLDALVFGLNDNQYDLCENYLPSSYTDNQI